MKLVHKILLLCFFGVLLFLTFNRHSKGGYFNYHSEIWADKAGYYIYLPAIKSNFNATAFPDSISEKTGNGFKIDSNKIITKYTCGVAIMQSPFFLLADLSANSLNQKSNGFSPVYHWSVNLAGVFYLFWGLVFLFKFLRTRFGFTSSFLTTAVVFLGSNLYFYGIDETGMSHVYSFFLFSTSLFLLQKSNFQLTASIPKNLLLGIIFGLIILIRPTNLLFLIFLLMFDIKSKEEIRERLRSIVNLKNFVCILLGAVIIITPQLIYWNYTFDSLLAFSYGEEGFNWLNPQLMKVWFSPRNGLFLYAPIFLLFIGGAAFMIKQKRINGILITSLFLVLSYVFSSWWFWSFGCSFGARSFIEYLALFSILLAFLFDYFKNSRPLTKGLYVICLAIVVFNLKLTYTYDDCAFSQSDWDWETYLELVVSPTK